MFIYAYGKYPMRFDIESVTVSFCPEDCKTWMIWGHGAQIPWLRVSLVVGECYAYPAQYLTSLLLPGTGTGTGTTLLPLLPLSLLFS